MTETDGGSQVMLVDASSGWDGGGDGGGGGEGGGVGGVGLGVITAPPRSKSKRATTRHESARGR